MKIEILIKIIFENLPILGGFFVIGGLVKIFSYYKFFGLYIYEFMDIKEVLTLFINNLLAYFIVLLFISMSILDIKFIGISKYGFPIIFTILTILYFLLRKNIFIYELIIINFFFWLFVIIIKEFLPTLNTQTGSFEEIKNFTLLFFLLTLIVYSLLNAINEYYKVKYKKYYSGTKILFDDFEFISNDNKYYIGKTEKFVFIHDKEKKLTDIIPVSRLKKITFKTI